MSDRPHLTALADHFGVLPGFNDISGEWNHTGDSTRLALLAAMGIDASTENAAAEALANEARAASAMLLPPARVIVADANHSPSVQLTAPGDHRSSAEWQVELREEGGRSHRVSGRSDVHETRRDMSVLLEVNPPPGYHRLHATLYIDDKVFEADQTLIVSPGVCVPIADRTGDRQAYGIWANLYTIRNERNWGVGDVTDLRDLVDLAGERGAAFIGINPLHALRNRNDQISPYCPVSRLFRNVLYLDVEAIPEWTCCAEAQARLRSADVQAELAQLRSGLRVCHQRVAALKDKILRPLHKTFVERHADASTDRGRAYTQYRDAWGEALVDFATFATLDAQFSSPGDCHGPSHWPAPYRHRNTPEVEAFRDAHSREIAFHCYLQFELDRQLGAAAERARQAGMGLGLYHDLALGSAACGSDAWAFPDVFVHDVEVGAPPDPYCMDGQIWGFPPINPRTLAAQRYEYWIQLIRSAMSHAGMLRIDHAAGLFRQFWVPAGRTAADGAYVRYPTDDLLGILALESHRHQTVVVGEDLGTVPPETPPTLQRRRILSSRVMHFEREVSGEFRRPEHYAPNALVVATVHDLPPLAGFWTGRDLEIRRSIGLFDDNETFGHAQAERDATRAALVRLFIETGLITHDQEPTIERIRQAAYAMLTRTPCPLVGVSLDDLAGELDPVNLPGVGPGTYESWSRRMHRELSAVMEDADTQRILDLWRQDGG